MVQIELNTLDEGKANWNPSRFMHSKTAATGPLPIERALKSDLVTILVACQVLYSNTNWERWKHKSISRVSCRVEFNSRPPKTVKAITQSILNFCVMCWLLQIACILLCMQTFWNVEKYWVAAELLSWEGFAHLADQPILTQFKAIWRLQH